MMIWQSESNVSDGNMELRKSRPWRTARFVIKAGGSAARGLSKPESVHLDELREMHDLGIVCFAAIYLDGEPKIHRSTLSQMPAMLTVNSFEFGA